MGEAEPRVLSEKTGKMKFREVTLVESDSARAEELAEKLDGVILEKEISLMRSSFLKLMLVNMMLP